MKSHRNCKFKAVANRRRSRKEIFKSRFKWKISPIIETTRDQLFNSKSSTSDGVRDRKESKDDADTYLYQSSDTTQDSEVKVPPEFSTLWEDLFSLRIPRIRSVDIQCYSLTQTNVVHHPTHVHGIQWENLNDEKLRLATYSNYPGSASKSILILARDGFVYTGDGSDDKVMCYYCCVTKSSWDTHEDVSEVHRSDCPMVTGAGSNNVPITTITEQFETVLNRLSDIDNPSVKDLRSSAATHQQHATNHDGRYTILDQDTRQQSGDINNDTPSDQPLVPVPSGARQVHKEISVIANGIPNASSQTTNNDHCCSAPTMSELVIPKEPSKYSEYASLKARLESFQTWSRELPQNPVTFAGAGFFYAGYADCVRCFQCGLGLRSWKPGDDIFVEHVRRFSECSFIRQLMGHNYVSGTQELNRHNKKITPDMIIASTGHPDYYYQRDERNRLKRDPAVQAIVDEGYNEEKVLEIATHLKSQGTQLSADVMLRKLPEDEYCTQAAGNQHTTRPISITSPGDNEHIQQLKQENNRMRQMTRCNICRDKNVEVVFLPCGHLVSCVECAGNFDDCPVCRTPVKGTVRAFIG